MRLGIDARELAGHATGVGRYLAELLATWSREPRAAGTRITLFAPHALDLPADLLGAGGASVDVAVLSGGAGTRWEQTRLPRGLGREIDVLFCPGYSAPLLTRAPVVVAIHDVSFWAHPEWFTPREGRRRRWLTKLSARRAAAVLTISSFSRGEIVRFLGVPPERVHVTWLAPWRAQTPHSVSAAGGTRPRAPVVLYVGTLLNRRQLPLLVRGFAPIARRTPTARLVIVGENRTFPAEDPAAVAHELGIAHAVDVRAYVTDAELAALYAEASAFAFLSTYEGFGLTPLEAMAADLPVVACDTPVAREVYGEAARLVPAGDVDRLTEALTLVLDDEGERGRLRAAARQVLAGLSWETTAHATLDVLERAARS